MADSRIVFKPKLLDTIFFYFTSSEEPYNLILYNYTACNIRGGILTIRLPCVSFVHFVDNCIDKNEAVCEFSQAKRAVNKIVETIDLYYCQM